MSGIQQSVGVYTFIRGEPPTSAQMAAPTNYRPLCIYKTQYYSGKIIYLDQTWRSLVRGPILWRTS